MNFDLERGKWEEVLFTEEQTEYIISKYKTNIEETATTIAEEFGLSYPTIIKLLKKNEVRLKTLREYRLTYEVDESFFEEINTEEKAYWLGFLYADAYVDEGKGVLRVNLSSVDRDHLEKLLQSLKSNVPIKETTKKTATKDYAGVYIGIYRPKIVRNLVSKGCYQNKSLTLTFPNSEIVPENLIHHFIRGYFDGDGCITFTNKKGEFSNRRQYKIKITGTESFLKRIQQHFDSKTKLYKPVNNNAYTADFGGNKQTKRLYEFMYKDATIYLGRKYEKFQEMLQYIEDNQYVAWNKGMKNYKKQNGE